MRSLLLLLTLGASLLAQQTINGSRIIVGEWDASGASSTKPVKAGTSVPGTCAVGDVFFKTDATAGKNFQLCTATDTWTAIRVDDGTLTLSLLAGAVTDAQVPNTITLDNLTQVTTRNHSDLTGVGTNTHAQIDTHLGSTANPHSTTADQVLPSQATNNGKYLSTNGTTASWETAPVTSVFTRGGAVTAQSGDYTATQVTNTPAGNIAATTVQAALNELDGEKALSTHNHGTGDVNSGTFADARISQSSVTQHQAALSVGGTQVTNTPAGNIIATTAQGAINELDSEKAPSSHNHATADVNSGTFADARISQSNVTQHQAALSIAGTQVTNTPAGTISATTVQTALNELDGEKAPSDHTHSGSAINTGTVGAAYLGSGTRDGTKYLRDDNTWQVPSGASHTQNTDTGTTATSFQVDSDATGPRLRNATGALEVRNSADDGYASVKASQLEAAGTANGKVELSGVTSGTVGITVLDAAGTWTLTLPATAGTNGQLLKTNGSGTMSWVDYSAAQVSNTPAGNIAATTVQTALNELDGEKAPSSHNHAGTDINSGTVGPAYLGTGARDGTKYLRDDGTWQAVSGGAHTQNTDTGTTQTSFQIDSGATGPRIKNASGTLEVRNSADNAYADVKTSTVSLPGATSGTVGIAVNAAAGTWTLTLPNSGGSSGQKLQTNGSGGASWVSDTRQFGYMVGAENGSALVDGDDQPTIFANRLGASITISEVWCESDGGTPSIQLQKDDGSPVNMLSSNLSCSTSGASTTGFVSGENVVADTNRVDFVMVTAGGTAKRITLWVKFTL